MPNENKSSQYFKYGYLSADRSLEYRDLEVGLNKLPVALNHLHKLNPQGNALLLCRYELLPLARYKTYQGNALLLSRCELLPLPTQIHTQGNASLLSRYELLPLAKQQPNLSRVKQHYRTSSQLCLSSDRFLYYDCIKHLNIHRLSTTPKDSGKIIMTTVWLQPSAPSKAAPTFRTAAAATTSSPPRSRAGRPATSPTPKRLSRSP